MGTKDPGHGSADVYIDGQLVETINTNATSRSTGTKIFESADLTDGHHTLRVVAKTSAAIGVEAAYDLDTEKATGTDSSQWLFASLGFLDFCSYKAIHHISTNKIPHRYSDID